MDLEYTVEWLTSQLFHLTTDVRNTNQPALQYGDRRLFPKFRREQQNAAGAIGDTLSH
jgi:hypothetical protein